MIHTNRVVTVGDQESIIDKPIVLYRGDREVEVEFELVGNEFMFTTEGNVIKSMNASHGQLVLNTPSGDNMFSELAECHDGKVVFVITKEMIDELIEVGFYSFQIRLYDGAEMRSRATIPPVLSGLDIRSPIAAEDETNVVDVAVVDYSRIYRDQTNEELLTFDWEGNYIKTEWVGRDLITENKLNKMEDAIWTVNSQIQGVNNEAIQRINQIQTQHQNDMNKLNTKDTQLTNDIQNVNRNLTNEVNKLRVDMEVGDLTVKDFVDEKISKEFDNIVYDKIESQIESQIEVDYDAFLYFDTLKPIIGYIDNDLNAIVLDKLPYGEYTLKYYNTDGTKTKIISYFKADENANLLDVAELYMNQRYSQSQGKLIATDGAYTIVFPIDKNFSNHSLQLIDLDIEVPLTEKGSTLYVNNADFTSLAYPNGSNYISLMTSNVTISNDGKSAEIIVPFSNNRNYIILSIIVKSDMAITHDDIANHVIKIKALD